MNPDPNNPPLDYQRIIVGYHGCDQSVAERVVLEHTHLRQSNNDYDWLGRGIYLWEYGPQRALEFAREHQERGKVDEPAVLGAYVNLGRCFDLTDVEHTKQLTEAFDIWADSFEEPARMPINTSGDEETNDLLLRYRDCALLNWYMRVLDANAERTYHYQTVRGVFVEGSPAFEGAGIFTKTHVQIAVRDPSCILGYFIPTFHFDGGDDDN